MNDSKAHIAASVPQETKAHLEALAATTGLNRSQVMRLLVDSATVSTVFRAAKRRAQSTPARQGNSADLLKASDPQTKP